MIQSFLTVLMMIDARNSCISITQIFPAFRHFNHHLILASLQYIWFLLGFSYLVDRHCWRALEMIVDFVFPIPFPSEVHFHCVAIASPLSESESAVMNFQDSANIAVKFIDDISKLIIFVAIIIIYKCCYFFSLHVFFLPSSSCLACSFACCAIRMFCTAHFDIKYNFYATLDGNRKTTLNFICARVWEYECECAHL